MEAKHVLSVEQIGQIIGRSTSCVRQYLDRSEFNSCRIKSEGGKIKYIVTSTMIEKLKSLIYNRRGKR